MTHAHPHDDHAHGGAGGSGLHHDDRHDHEHRRGLIGAVLSVFKPHSHDSADKVDTALETNERGIWALKVSLVGLGLTALFQLGIVAISGSVALFADTVHNFSDALTAVPLWIAFAQTAQHDRAAQMINTPGRAG